MKKGVKFQENWLFNFHQKQCLTPIKNCHFLGLHLSEEEFLQKTRLGFLSHPSSTFQKFWDLYAACSLGNVTAVKFYVRSKKFHLDGYCLAFAMAKKNCQVVRYLLTLSSFVEQVLTRDSLLHFLAICTRYRHRTKGIYFSWIFRILIAKNLLDDSVRRTIVGYLVTNERTDLIREYLDLDFAEEMYLQKMVVKLAIEKKRFYMMEYMAEMYYDDVPLPCPKILIPTDYFNPYQSWPPRRASIDVILILLKLNVKFQDHTYVFEQSKKSDAVFLQLLKANIYKNEFTNWCESDPNNKSRCYEIIRKHIL